MNRVKWMAAATIVLGCGGDTAKTRTTPTTATLSTTPTVVSETDRAKHNQAVGHMGRFEIREAEKILAELAERYPDNETIVVDRAIAGMHRIEGGAAGIPMFEAALQRFPDSIRARYGLAYLYFLNGKIDESAELLAPLAERIETGELRDPHIAHRYAFALENSPKSEVDPQKWFKKAVELDPFFYTAAFRVASRAALAGQKAEATKYRQQHERLKSHPFGFTNEAKHRRMGPLLDVIPLENREVAAKPVELLMGEVFLEPVPLVTRAEWDSAKPSPTASMTVCDIDGDKLLDVFIADANVAVGGKTAHNAVLFQQEGMRFRLDVEHPLSGVANATAALWGDVDNDGLTDVFLCGQSGNQQWRQTSPKKWERFDETKSAVGPKRKCNSGVLWDADFDGDLDVFLVYNDGPNELLQNNGSGVFKAMGKELGVAGPGKGSRQALAVHGGPSRMAELIVLVKEGLPRRFIPDVKGGFVIDSNPAFDRAYQYAVGIAEPLTAFGKMTYGITPLSGRIRAELADIDGSGVLASFSTVGQTINGGKQGESRQLSLPTLPKAAAWTFANFDVKRGPSLVVMPQDGSPPVAAHPGPGRHDFFSLSFIGDKDNSSLKHKSNRSGIGVKVSMRIGDRWACQFPLSQSSGPGQSLQPIAIGTAGAASADFLFIDWSNGDFQSEFSPPVGKTTVIKELDRTPLDSCPLLFVWNGKKYEFVTDFLGVGGIDYLVRPGEYYTPTDPVEHLLIPNGVLPADGSSIKLKILEPAEEITFLDRAALVAYDLPPNWEMTLDERHSALPPKPTHEPRFFRVMHLPTKASNESNADCTEAIQRADRKAAASPKADHKFTGRFERPHQLTIEFAKPIGELCRRPVLVMDGWLAFPDAQAVMNASQAGVAFSAPTLEAMGADGKWTVVFAEFGYPAGMQRQMSLPLERLPKGAAKLRITHELEAYWDRIALVDVESAPEVRRTEVQTTVAKLSAVGSPRYDRNREGKPFWFDYDDRNPFWPARAPSGEYTRFGDCRELIETGDDASATIGPGEEVHLEFKAPESPPKGWTRRYVLETRGWCRGMRIYTRNGSTVEPMPSSGLPTEAKERLHRKFNTRVVWE